MGTSEYDSRNLAEKDENRPGDPVVCVFLTARAIAISWVVSGAFRRFSGAIRVFWVGFWGYLGAFFGFLGFWPRCGAKLACLGVIGVVLGWFLVCSRLVFRTGFLGYFSKTDANFPQHRRHRRDCESCA